MLENPQLTTSILLGPGLLELRLIGSIRCLTKLHLISLDLISHLCPGLHAITNFTILRRKIAAATIFRTLQFSVSPSSFFSLTRRASESKYTNSAKIEKNRDHDDFLQFTFSCSLLACLASQTALPNSTNSARMAKNHCQNDLSYLTIFCYCFVLFSLKCPKLFRFPTRLSYFSVRLHHLAEPPM